MKEYMYIYVHLQFELTRLVYLFICWAEFEENFE